LVRPVLDSKVSPPLTAFDDLPDQRKQALARADSGAAVSIKRDFDGNHSVIPK
jgi:hypothetical protein